MIEFTYFIVGATLSGIISWVITKHYYVRSDKNKPSWFSVESIKEIISSRPDDINWTAKQIVNLYNNKLFSNNSDDPLPFKYCPTCGSDKLKRGSHIDTARDEWYCFIECSECGWSDWSQ